jgi:hypothetical protein
MKSWRRIAFCHACGVAIVRCPTHYTFSGWKHMDTGKHRCNVNWVWANAYPLLYGSER